MKAIIKSVLVISAALAASSAFASTRQPTEVVHFSAKAAFTNSGVEPGASGTIQATETKQGAADKEALTLAIKGLTPGDPYNVVIPTVSNSNPLAIDSFNADGKGNAKLSFNNNGKKKTIPFI